MEVKSKLYFNFENGEFISGDEQGMLISKKKFKDIKSVFLKPEDKNIADDEIMYEVTGFINKEKAGELNFGVTKIFPGTVNNEFYMTKGHYHEKMSHTEYYWGIKGRGLLVLKDSEGNCSVVTVEKNSLHYIPENTAHRLINVSDEPLVVGACWPSDAGHNYGEILEKGFPVRVFKSENGYIINEIADN
jgi:glucose-6-phosphate isomerase